ncbi:DUF1995 family protein [Prochlorococcus marinus]|uniref:DUF1995 domain-containing protein n=1 Tax=Prochlorococcus marinus XMU1408 TaxID=2213228 RepID=A0A318RB68_PROMR|nr:DUF1995 family protein [Prochlorococcus marinus]MBW3041953.1 DUF1995 domain-containing protein [Prochlorococcus marinus str. XMU1408]PYE03079.1 DUF1995 domain-containing protein [Prochlorococcus marinus XMU1408]
MNNKLPSDLREAESNVYESIQSYFLSNSEQSFLSINLKFEGLRINPIIFRLSNKLTEIKLDNILLWADAGGAALAKRDNPNLTNKIFTFKEFINSTDSLNSVLLVCSPQPYDIETFEQVCSHTNSSVIMINGKLEDPIVGIGSVGREMRKRFAKKWQVLYFIQPLSMGALLKRYPYNWELFKLNANGYSFVKSFDKRPDDETIILNL